MFIAAESYEWVKILISALAGLFTGLVAEPFKAAIQARVSSRRALSALRYELKRLLRVLEVARIRKFDATILGSAMQLPAYDYYRDKEGRLFYESADLRDIGYICSQMKTIALEMGAGRKTSEVGLAELTAKVHDALAKEAIIPKMKRRLKFRFTTPKFLKPGVQTAASPEGKSNPPGTGTFSGP